MDYEKIFCERLKLLRDSHGFSQKQVAEAVGVSRTGYIYVETGRKKPSFDTLIALADFFDVSLDYLVGRPDRKEVNQ